jgi:hypothetical protein
MDIELEQVRLEMRQGFDRVMAKLQKDYESGEPASLLIAVEMCLMHAASWGTAPPEWVVRAYSDRLWRYMSQESGSLDEAFGSTLPVTRKT